MRRCLSTGTLRGAFASRAKSHEEKDKLTDTRPRILYDTPGEYRTIVAGRIASWCHSLLNGVCFAEKRTLGHLVYGVLSCGY